MFFDKETLLNRTKKRTETILKYWEVAALTLDPWKLESVLIALLACIFYLLSGFIATAKRADSSFPDLEAGRFG